MEEINKNWCTNTHYDGQDKQYICEIMKKPCPYVKPYYTEDCVEMAKQVEIDALTAVATFMTDNAKDLSK